MSFGNGRSRYCGRPFLFSGIDARQGHVGRMTSSLSMPSTHSTILRLGLTASTFLLLACHSIVPAWSDDGDSVTDLRTLRIRGRKQVLLAKGLTLHADEVRFTDKSRASGEAVGRVFLEAGPEAPYGLLMNFAYSGKASFDLRNDFVVLSDHPMLEWDNMTQIATAPYTAFRLHWTSLESQVTVEGPTRTDFAKSHRIPAGVTIASDKMSALASKKGR